MACEAAKRLGHEDFVEDPLLAMMTWAFLWDKPSVPKSVEYAAKRLEQRLLALAEMLPTP